ncbi:MAG: pyrroline-5-carboxylate reductase, partial [Phycisphaerales bacterium]|nr:pyrroline-5-carboxylate reductase [Phycisphaerales bacterium]
QPLVLSILAGIHIEQIEQIFDHKARVIRVMPNTPAQIGKAMSAISPSPQATTADIELATRLFSSIGKAITISEDLMDAFTAIAGSGPAYVFYLAEAMIEAALQLGFDKQQAQTIVRQTIFGSASLMDKSPEMPRQLREQVTSKKGTTQAATDTLDEYGVMDAIVRAIHAACHRGAELGKTND